MFYAFTKQNFIIIRYKMNFETTLRIVTKSLFFAQ